VLAKGLHLYMKRSKIVHKPIGYNWSYLCKIQCLLYDQI